MVGMDPNTQQDPQLAWSFTGVTAPEAFQSTDAGTAFNVRWDDVGVGANVSGAAVVHDAVAVVLVVVLPPDKGAEHVSCWAFRLACGGGDCRPRYWDRSWSVMSANWFTAMV